MNSNQSEKLFIYPQVSQSHNNIQIKSVIKKLWIAILDQTNTESPNQKDFRYLVDKDEKIFGLPSLFLARQKEYKINFVEGMSLVGALCSELCDDASDQDINLLEKAAKKNNEYAKCELFLDGKNILEKSEASRYRTTLKYEKGDEITFGSSNPFNVNEGRHQAVIDGIFFFLTDLKKGSIIKYSVDQSENPDINHREKNTITCELV